MLESFKKHINEINEDVVAMSEMVATATSRSVEALGNRDIEKAKQIVNDDLLINKKRGRLRRSA